ncbi:cytidylyltransferase domain-containing protein [Methanobrevibacter sp.]|uniref:cytidylyltransferase domain-containing protein n=1 Tax=Methanobrevibacter sp. TaxID=66852 RepID=UPI00388E9CE9
MFDNNKILVVIPARGGSKGIPRKNIRLLNNRPLISYAIGTARSSQYVDDVVLTTDDSEIALIAEKFGASVVRRSHNLSDDNIPLEPVIYNAMVQKEKLAFDEYDIVITLQPTSPLIKPSTLDNAIEKFKDFSVDSVISVVDDRHLNWGYDEDNNRYFPIYSQRVDRQLLPKSFKETGAILATRRSFVHEDSCLGTNVDLIEVSREESVNIENFENWSIAENYLQKKRIAIVVNANNEIGTGHVYRCLSIASRLFFHDVLFLLDGSHQLGIDILDRYKFPYEVYKGDDDLFNKLAQYGPHIVINDILDTTTDYILKLRSYGYFVVNFEDLGKGSEVADMVFDSLYEHDLNQNHIFTGHKYFILKDEFYFQPKKIITQGVNNVLIAFGGTDSNNLTEKVLNSILKTNFEGRINVILGLGYPDKEGLISKIESNHSIQVYTDVPSISEFMFKADIIFTSASRIIYDICSLGVPTICLCQTEREQSHVFASNDNGFINMGLGVDVDETEIMNQFIELVNDYDRRMEMNEKMLSIDLKNGFENIQSSVKEQYRNFVLNKRFQ